MLNGRFPLFIFSIKKLIPTSFFEDRPLLAEINEAFPLLFIPLYLDEKATGILIDSESKNVDIDSEIETLASGKDPKLVQKGVNSSVTISMTCTKDSIGMSVLSALVDLIFSKVTSDEYGISYFNGPILIFNGRIDTYTVTQNTFNNLYSVYMTIQRGTVNSTASTAASAASIPKTPLNLPSLPGVAL